MPSLPALKQQQWKEGYKATDVDTFGYPSIKIKDNVYKLGDHFKGMSVHQDEIEGTIYRLRDHTFIVQTENDREVVRYEELGGLNKNKRYYMKNIHFKPPTKKEIYERNYDSPAPNHLVEVLRDKFKKYPSYVSIAKDIGIQDMTIRDLLQGVERTMREKTKIKLANFLKINVYTLENWKLEPPRNEGENDRESE